MAVGIWVSIDGPSFLKIFGPLSSSAMQFVNVGYFLIAAGAVLFALGFLGCYGAQTENKCALMMVCHTRLHGPGTETQGPLTLESRPWGSPNPALDSRTLSRGGRGLVLRGGGLPLVRHEGPSLSRTQTSVPPSVLLDSPPHLHRGGGSCCGRAGVYHHGEEGGGEGERSGRALQVGCGLCVATFPTRP